MHVLITRPERDAADLKARIEALGCRVTLAPLLDIELLDVAAGTIDAASAIVVTSRNGLRALAKSPALDQARSLLVFAVGDATATLARGMGFERIVEGQGTAASLVPLIVEHASTQTGAIVHLAGDHTAFDLAGALLANGIPLKTVEAYRAVACKTLLEPVPALLAEGAVDAVILMSPRTARTWSDLTQALPRKTDFTKVTHICLSHAVAEGLHSPAPVPIEVASQPNSGEIVALVYRLAARTKTG